MDNVLRRNATRLASAFILAAIFPQAVNGADKGNFQEKSYFGENGKYVSGKIGPNSLEESGGGQTDFDTGFAFLGAFGFDFNDVSSYGRVRVEGELGFRENDAESQNLGFFTLQSGSDVDQTSFMANAYHDFLPGSKFRPYLGLGIGLVSSDASGNAGGSSTDFAYQAMIGLSYKLNRKWALDGEYRYTEVDADTDLENQGLLFGLRYGF